MSIGENIQYYRNQSGLSIDDFARDVNLSACDCREIESGKRRLSSAEIQTICRVLNVSLDNLLSDNPTPEDHGSVVIPVAELQALLGKMNDNNE